MLSMNFATILIRFKVGKFIKIILSSVNSDATKSHWELVFYLVRKYNFSMQEALKKIFSTSKGLSLI